MKQRVIDLRAQGDHLFGGRSSLMSLWQETAEHFFPLRADFTVTRTLGSEYASHLMTGAPALAHRELSDQFAAMLRPRGKDWFTPTVEAEKVADDVAVKAWLEDKAAIMRRVMYAPQARFTRATKEGDQDFAAFGQAVLSAEVNSLADGLLYRCWHLKDCAWAESATGAVDTMHRKWRLAARSLVKLFPKTVDAKVRKLLEKEPNREIPCRHIVIPADEYDFRDKAAARKAERFPFVSLYIDEENETILEEVPRRRLGYIVPRWMTAPGSPYAHSPATVIALPDARLLQKITLTLIEAGEKAVNPPMVAQGDMVQGGINAYAGGVTWVDSDYDERQGEAIRVLDAFAKGNLAFGTDMADRYEALIKRAFYLDQINLPPAGAAMTATEVRTRVEEYIRAALPLFEPMELEYNGALCEESFALCMENGAFGNLADMPPALGGEEIKFQFQSPLQAAQSRDKAQAFLEASQLLATATTIDPEMAVEMDVRAAFRDALDGAQVPAKWITPDEQAVQARDAMAQQKKMEQAAQAVAAGAGVAGQVGDAATRLQQAGLIPQAGAAPAIQGAPV